MDGKALPAAASPISCSYTRSCSTPAEVAFKKNWQRDQNLTELDLTRRVSDADARKILSDAQAGLDKLFAKAFQEAGYEIVTTPGPDVRASPPLIINLDVEAPPDSCRRDDRSPSRRRRSHSRARSAKDSAIRN